MDPPSSDVPKLPDMVMCGDHPSFTKTELNAKETKPEEKEKLKERMHHTYARISPTSSRTERGERGERGERALRALAARRRVRSLEAVPRAADQLSPDNRALLNAALGSFRWPPYLLCVWVCVLVLTHALHCAAALLERALPAFKKVCQYFRAWTEESWKAEGELSQRVWPAALAGATAALYAAYALLYALRAAAAWAIEPLCPDVQDVKLTDYEHDDDAATKTNSLNT